MRVDVWFDGGCRSNPNGPAAGAAVILDREDGRTLTHVGKHIGIGSNNVAEWTGLIEGLRAALKLGATDVRIFGDSQLVVRQFNGEYQVSNETMRRLFTEALELRRRFPTEIQAAHVPRERNKAADAICRAVLDGTYVADDPLDVAAGAISRDPICFAFIVEVELDKQALREAVAAGGNVAAIRKAYVQEVERKLILTGSIGNYTVRPSRVKG